MKRKYFIGIIVLVLLLGVAYFVYTTFIVAVCIKANYGWSCQFKTGISIAQYEKKCQNQGGKWTCYGFCSPDYDHFCYFPYDDAGKGCLDSDQCKGSCIVANIDAAEGVCSEYPLSGCGSRYYELNNGIVESKGGDLCD